MLVRSLDEDVLWPPRTIVRTDRKTTKAVRAFISGFEKALQDDANLRCITERVRNDELLSVYDIDEREHPTDRELPEEPEWDDPQGQRRVPESTRTANELLRKVTNRLSLAFYVRSLGLIFLGDVETDEIPQIVAQIRHRPVYCMVAPHHGTHWHDALATIPSVYTVAANGHLRSRYLKPQFANTGAYFLDTYRLGDIGITLPG